MSVRDPIGDMLTRVRNASIIGHSLVAMPSSRIKVAIANILKEEGYIQDFEVTQEEGRPQATLRLWLKYVGDRRHRVPAITGVKRVSTPGCRVYSQKGDHGSAASGDDRATDLTAHYTQLLLGRSSKLAIARLLASVVKWQGRRGKDSKV